jgi:hypothetical protein
LFLNVFPLPAFPLLSLAEQQELNTHQHNDALQYTSIKKKMNKEEKSQEHRFQIRQRFMSQEKFTDKVAMREISQDDTKMSNGRIEKKIRPLLFTTRPVPSQIQILKSTSKGLATDP